MGYSFIDPSLDPFPDRSEDPEAYIETLKPHVSLLKPKKKKKIKITKKIEPIDLTDPFYKTQKFDTLLDDCPGCQQDYTMPNGDLGSPLILVALLGLLLLLGAK